MAGAAHTAHQQRGNRVLSAAAEAEEDGQGGGGGGGAPPPCIILEEEGVLDLSQPEDLDLDLGPEAQESGGGGYCELQTLQIMHEVCCLLLFISAEI